MSKKSTGSKSVHEIRNEIRSYPLFLTSVGFWAAIRHKVHKEKMLIRNNPEHKLDLNSDLSSIVKFIYKDKKVPEAISRKIASLTISAQATNVADDILSVFDPVFFKNREKWKIFSRTYKDGEVEPEVILNISKPSVRDLIDKFLIDGNLEEYSFGISKECGLTSSSSKNEESCEQNCSQMLHLTEKVENVKEEVTQLKEEVTHLKEEAAQLKEVISQLNILVKSLVQSLV